MRKQSDYTKITVIGVVSDLFKANGYTETSVDSIASAAQTTKKLFMAISKTNVRFSQQLLTTRLKQA
jgi:hypothetical protein